jgi:polysaccharide export outer membrane protein
MRLLTTLPAALLLSLLGSCSTGSMPAAPTLSDAAPYRLGSGDGLRVIVYGEDKLSGEYHVSDSGTVTLPLIGTIKAADLSIDDLGRRIADAYRTGGFLTEPRVAAEVLTYRPFFILGEVTKPGQYPFIPGLTVNQAIATANGYTYRADTKTVRITRFGQKEEVRYRLNPGAMVGPGDTIRVPERHF